MKLTIILLLAASLQLSARGFSQEITLKENNASLEKVFREIKKQTGYVFWYEDKLLQKAKPVNISVKNATLEQVLQLLFKNQSLAYEIIGKTVVIKLKEEAKTVDSVIVQQASADIKISGKVADENGNLLQGVSIQLKGSSIGTTTNEKGEFQINIPDNSSGVLIFSYVGMQTQEVNVAGKNDIKITLKIADNQQQEVVIVGYGTQRKSQLTAAVSSVKGSDLVKTRAVDLASALQGMAPGVTVTSPTGAPGTDAVEPNPAKPGNFCKLLNIGNSSKNTFYLIYK